jgi:hypothetical protein
MCSDHGTFRVGPKADAPVRRVYQPLWGGELTFSGNCAFAPDPDFGLDIRPTQSITVTGRWSCCIRNRPPSLTRSLAGLSSVQAPAFCWRTSNGGEHGN